MTISHPEKLKARTDVRNNKTAKMNRQFTTDNVLIKSRKFYTAFSERPDTNSSFLINQQELPTTTSR
jgi:hypothetical protein